MNRTVMFGGVVLLILIVSGGVWLAAAPQVVHERRPSMEVASTVQTTAAAPRIVAVAANPNVIIVNTPTIVIANTQITDPGLIAGSVNLLRLGATGTQPTILGVMHDDGLNGDRVADDHIYTIQMGFTEPVAGQFQLQVSAAFRGALQRVLSNPTNIQISPPIGLSQFTDNQSHLAILYPTGSQISKDGTTTNFYDVTHADLPATMEVEVFTPQINSAEPRSQT